MKLKAGDKVKFKDNDPSIYVVYHVYSNTSVSLGLGEYPDVEQDNQVNINQLERV